ncbi:hypothetical protein ISN59_12860 (plasmid) [Enterococcus faecalis]|uniref:hypothetical protein n=1 Tax=Enterococcus faecalis TaxID=1351 RepID=UPI001E61287A|nr:hypothetical protein [Enterococcus faecalis]UEP66901.1 hypothetical protein ISN59_12860 [Enterococcus faecalis]
MTEKIDLNKLYHESKKERTEKQTKMERALEGVVCGFPRNTADDPIWFCCKVLNLLSNKVE